MSAIGLNKGLGTSHMQKGDHLKLPRGSRVATSKGHQEQCHSAATAASGKAGSADRVPPATEVPVKLAVHSLRAFAVSRTPAEAGGAYVNPNPGARRVDVNAKSSSKFPAHGKPVNATSASMEDKYMDMFKCSPSESHSAESNRARSTRVRAVGSHAKGGSASGALKSSTVGLPADATSASAKDESKGKFKPSPSGSHSAKLGQTRSAKGRAVGSPARDGSHFGAFKSSPRGRPAKVIEHYNPEVERPMHNSQPVGQ